MVDSRILIFPLLGLIGCSQQEEPPLAKSNVVIISIDSLRQDRLGCYGHQPEFAPDLQVSPNIDAVAAAGVVFENAFSTSSWTLPSHAALMTGMDDRGHGVETADRRIDPQHHVLAETLQRNGWSTFGVYSGGFLDPRHGFDRGFKRYLSAMLDANTSSELVKSEQQRLDALSPGIEWTSKRLARLRKIVLRYDASGERVTDRALEMLAESSGPDQPPFFLFAHYFDVHHDYLPELVDPQLARDFDPDYQGQWDGRDWTERAVLGARRERAVGERDLAHIRAMYDGEIHLVDRQLGRLFGYLQEHDLWDNTVVVIVSDHGEEFFEHGGITHARTLHQELLRIPMIIKPASNVNGTGGVRVDNVVGIQNLANTILDLLGLEPLADGTAGSLSALWAQGITSTASGDTRSTGTGVATGTISRLQIISRSGTNIRDAWRDQEFSVLRWLIPNQDSGELHLAKHPITGADATLVYDLRSDPGENHPLPLADTRVAIALERFRRDFDYNEAAASQLTVSSAAECRAPPHTAEELAFLDALGYTSPSSSSEENDVARWTVFPRP